MTTVASGFSNYFNLLCLLSTLGNTVQKTTWKLLIGCLVLKKLENSSRTECEVGKVRVVHMLSNIPNLTTSYLTQLPFLRLLGTPVCNPCCLFHVLCYFTLSTEYELLEEGEGLTAFVSLNAEAQNKCSIDTRHSVIK